MNLPDQKQIGFIILAMMVTRSTVLTLQAKLRLPRGNQIVGWFVLGRSFTSGFQEVDADMKQPYRS